LVCVRLSHRIWLLDWLAVEFMEPLMPTRKSKSGIRNRNGKPWSLKHLHRLIVNSAAYRQSSRHAGALKGPV
jgi:hypothetical protein